MEAEITQKRTIDFSKVQVPIFAVIALLHVGALCAFIPALFTWLGFITFIVWIPLTACVGITFGYHRMFTHNSYQAVWIVRFVVLFCATVAMQGKPSTWVRNHYFHHKHSDKKGDPHSPLEGFWWAHLFWMWFVYDVLVDEVHFAKGGDRDMVKKFAEDPLVKLFDQYYLLPPALVAVAVTVLGYFLSPEHPVLTATSCFVWNCARTVLVYHGTWTINSITHMEMPTSYRNHETADRSRNNWLSALLSFGEGWHNNHHGKQRKACNWERWFEVDLTWILILTCESLGLVNNVFYPDRRRWIPRIRVLLRRVKNIFYPSRKRNIYVEWVYQWLRSMFVSVSAMMS